MDYKQKYEEALENIKKIKTANKDNKELIDFIEFKYPELKESEDERTIKAIIEFIKQNKSFTHCKGVSKDDCLTWLERQGEESKRLYVRFGEIPEDECSGVYHAGELVSKEEGVSVYHAGELVSKDDCLTWLGEIPEDECSGVYHAGELVGKEEGVSVYDAKIDNYDNIFICIPLPINENTLDTLQNLVEYESRNCYLVKGTCIGKGSDNEPIIRNVSIVKRINNYRIKESDKKSDQNLNKSCKTCKDEQKPTWSEEDEEMRIYTCKFLDDAKQIDYRVPHKEDIDKCISWLKSLKERMKGE